MAPTGAISNYKRVPRGLLVLDRSLSETAPGEFTVFIHIPVGGHFDVPVFVDQPRITACFQVTIRDTKVSNKTAQSGAISAQPLHLSQALTPGVPVALAFKLTYAEGAEAFVSERDLDVTIFRAPGVWQKHSTARPLGGGVYEVTLSFPAPGQYHFVFVTHSFRSRDIVSTRSIITVRQSGATQ